MFLSLPRSQRCNQRAKELRKYCLTVNCHLQAMPRHPAGICRCRAFVQCGLQAQTSQMQSTSPANAKGSAERHEIKKSITVGITPWMFVWCLQTPANVFHFVLVSVQIQLRGYLKVIQRLIRGYFRGYLKVNSIFTRLWENCLVRKELISILLNKATFKHLL